MSVRDALSEAVGLIVDIYDQGAIPDGYTILWDAVCDFVESRRGSDALAALREQAGVDPIAFAIFESAGDDWNDHEWPPGVSPDPWPKWEALADEHRDSWRRKARAALRALGLEDA